MKNHTKYIFIGMMFVLFSFPIAQISTGMEPATPPVQTEMDQESIDQLHKELLGKVKKLDGDHEIYVGAGFSDAGEPMFFGMERLDDRNFKTWDDYSDLLDDFKGRVISNLYYETGQCHDGTISPDEIKFIGSEEYIVNLKKSMCAKKGSLEKLLGSPGMMGGVKGFQGIMTGYKKEKLYVAYASKKPIRGLFSPKNPIDIHNFTVKDFEDAYGDLIISIAVRDNVIAPTSTHRGIFKNPFQDIRNHYNYVAMKLHGWAATVEKLFFKKRQEKKYVLIQPTQNAEISLQRSFENKPGSLFIGVDDESYPYGNLKLYPDGLRLKRNFLLSQNGKSMRLIEVREIFGVAVREIVGNPST